MINVFLCLINTSMRLRVQCEIALREKNLFISLDNYYYYDEQNCLFYIHHEFFGDMLFIQLACDRFVILRSPCRHTNASSVECLILICHGKIGLISVRKIIADIIGNISENGFSCVQFKILWHWWNINTHSLWIVFIFFFLFVLKTVLYFNETKLTAWAMAS